MAWRDTLLGLRDELALARQERLALLQEENEEREQIRRQLSELASTLQIEHRLQEMNSVMLDGRGKIETFVSWEISEEDEEIPVGLSDLEFLGSLGDDEEDTDVISLVLSWEEDGLRELDVDVGDSDDGIYLQVAGAEIRQEAEALEDALLEAFRSELEL
jgi:hypothetical protein